jgi:signal transduction histidine kinase
VTLRARREDSTVCVDVCDTGIGIAPENLERIFEPFWQVEQSARRRVGGTGLGLSVSRRLAELLGGTLTATSEAGKGSVFSVSLPLAGGGGPASGNGAGALRDAEVGVTG